MQSIKKSLLTLISAFMLFSLFVSIFPWSIKPFLHRLIRNDYQAKVNKLTIPSHFVKIALYIAQNLPNDSSLAFISRDPSESKDFFLLSYLIFPRRLYWVNNKPKEPISWWYQMELSPNSLKPFFDRYGIQWIITYRKDEYGIKEYAEQVTQDELFTLWERK